MATSIDEKPKTWAETFRTTPESTALNKIHGEVVDLFKVTSADKLDENSRQKMFDQVKNLQLDAMIFKSPVDESLQVLHHSYKLGGDLLNKEEIYFSLFGGGTVAVPVVYKPKSILTIASIDCPGWTTIKAIRTPEDFENAAPSPARPRTIFLTNAIPVPPFLAEAIIDMEFPSVYDCFSLFRAAAKKFDEENKDNATVPESTETMKIVLSYLWALGHNHLDPVPFQPSVRPSVTKTCSDLHMTFLHVEPENPPPTDTATSKEPSLLEKMNSSLETIVENNIMGHTTLASSSSKRKFKNRLTSIFQTLLLTKSNEVRSSAQS